MAELASSIVSGVSSLGSGFLNNQQSQIQGEYQKALAELKAKTDLSHDEYQLALARINADYESKKAANDQSVSRSRFVLIGAIMGVLCLTAVSIVLIIKRTAPLAAQT